MAHVGKFYRVAFRRDFNLDVGNNRKGFAFAYEWGTQQCFGSIGSLLDGKVFHLEALDEATYDGIHWKSDIKVLDGYHTYVEMFTTDDPTTKGVRTTGGLFTNEVGVLSTFKANPPGALGYAQLNNGWDSFFPPHPGLFLPSFNSSWSAAAKRW